MLKGLPTKGTVLYYVVNDFDGCGIHKVMVTEITYNNCIRVVGIEGTLEGVSLLFEPGESNIFSTYGEAKSFLNYERNY